MSEIKQKLKRLKEKGEMALIPFMMASLPDEDLCIDCIKALEQAGCDVLELGVPFSDPLADGEIIEKIHHYGVQNGLNLKSSLEFAHKVSSVTSLSIIMFSYLNPIYQMGKDSFIKMAESAGIKAVIIPDLPLDEMPVTKNQDMDLIPMLAPSSTDERLKMVSDLDPAFIYCVSVRGVTGLRSLPEDEVQKYLLRVRKYTDTPLALGFGISSPVQVKAFKGYADGIVVGSLLAAIMEEYRSKPHLLPGELERVCFNLKQATKG